ncbi:MAG: 4Fe-4S binding protein [Coriobacteriia bacterium]|nr:4Fe-4S binding protein [Coriobacteriia bacterium]MCL2536714.1 4Fe-4S binding protein [Coriobacteriia bacterium]
MPRIVVDEFYCKGCDLCVVVCPENIMAMDHSRLTAKGYHPAMQTDASKCNACTNCAIICPDVAITVYKEVAA